MINKNIKHILAIDIGGTYIKYAIFNTNFQIINKNKLPNPMDNNFDQLKVTLFNIFKMANKFHKIDGVAISSLGVVNSSNDNIFWSGTKRYRYKNYDFNSIFNNLPIYIENDVNSAIIGEKHFGKINKDKNVFMITLGTGIGGSALINGNLYTGYNNFAGEVGSMIINGKKWEDIASVSALIKNLPNYLKKYQLSEIVNLSMNNYNIFKYIDEWYKNIAIGIINICTIFNPKKFIIGGGISSNKNFKINRIIYHIKKLTTNNHYLINYYTLQKASLGNDAALYGVVYLYLQKFNKDNL